MADRSESSRMSVRSPVATRAWAVDKMGRTVWVQFALTTHRMSESSGGLRTHGDVEQPRPRTIAWGRHRVGPGDLVAGLAQVGGELVEVARLRRGILPLLPPRVERDGREHTEHDDEVLGGEPAGLGPPVPPLGRGGGRLG